MKKPYINFPALLIFFVLFIVGCDKDNANKEDPDPENTGYRIISTRWFISDQGEGETIFEYSGNKLSKSKYQNSDGSGYEEAVFEYPNENKILIHYTEEEDGEIYEGTIRIEYEDGKIIEFVEGDERYTCTYNDAGQIEQILDYSDDGNGWELYETITFSYSSDKLESILHNNGSVEEQYKSEFSYSGDKIEKIVHFIKDEDSQWIEGWKEVYSYTSGMLSNIEYYEYDTDYETAYYYEEFKYDNNGNLIEWSEINLYDDDFENIKLKYTYEKGSGNYHQIFNAYYFDYDYYLSRPLPTKSTEKFSSNKHVRIIGKDILPLHLNFK